ncbi:MAG: UDP-N-acetylmuramoyl-L-alanyl-D-glutamate--2,6-diaminopimelate ligase [Lentisphaerae bacterium]|nr:UDP-N-acetylmuramoyl-L-alanyl-D-glutamate--2,6-diaminopimelate ligase [Lentisphaerota bacterium]MCP4100126.1 UDP-N-acetylmuramoyl-L-alanyl-D-glutamate--2,6-diaminopimelate ligase [Lentisphaerota bacterium]
MKLFEEYFKYISKFVIESHIVDNSEITTITCDSRKVSPGAIFCAIPGAQTDGHNFIDTAINNGAKTIICSRNISKYPDCINKIKVTDTYHSYALLCEFFFDIPCTHLDLHGITGTNGKTTCAYLLHKVLTESQIRTGLLSTVEYRCGNEILNAQRTTPEAFQLQKLFNDIKTAGCSAAVMEVSSHGLDQHRTGSSSFKTAIFTNLSGDHLDYHQNMENYFNAKARLFKECLANNGTAIINIDDSFGKRLYQEIEPSNKVSFGQSSNADCQIIKLRSDHNGSTCKLKLYKQIHEFKTPLIGEYNAYNCVGVFCAAVFTGINPERILSILAEKTSIPGRLESFRDQREVSYFVDYAHTDDALENVLKNLRHIAPARLITVFGCGGDRDSSKRPRMAHAAEKYSDIVIVTSDNPRTENPLLIIDDIMTGFKEKSGVLTNPDREAAIKLAAKLAKPDDFIVVAGKGHETYQEINGKRYDFDDREIIMNLCSSN